MPKKPLKPAKGKTKPTFVKMSLSLSAAAAVTLQQKAKHDAAAASAKINVSETASRLILIADKALMGASTFPKN